MITALDTNILLDIWLPDPVFGPKSWDALMKADEEGGLIICEVVYAELASQFPNQAAFDARLDDLDIKVTAVPRAAAYRAGVARMSYLREGGKRTRILPDFLIAAHASVVADRFLTRDQGFYRTHFPNLKLIDPGK